MMMDQSYRGPERRRAPIEETLIKRAVREAVREAVQDELRKGNIVDGPTHIAHHQAISEFLEMTQHAKKTMVGVMVGSFLALVALGFITWVWTSKS